MTIPWQIVFNHLAHKSLQWDFRGQTRIDLSSGGGNLAGHKLPAAPGRPVVEQNAEKHK